MPDKRTTVLLYGALQGPHKLTAAEPGLLHGMGRGPWQPETQPGAAGEARAHVCMCVYFLSLLIYLKQREHVCEKEYKLGAGGTEAEGAANSPLNREPDTRLTREP